MKKLSKVLLPATAIVVLLASCKTHKVVQETYSNPNDFTSAPPPTPPAQVFTYDTVANDPLRARIYTLNNGLKVYMTVYKDAPRIQTYIAVRAGSKHDPSDATGLAHYLEHMLFKGTDKYGTKDYAKEAPELQKIEDLYEVYRKTVDTTKRKMLYHQIDSISGVAATFAIANEYDKMCSSMGTQGTNAHTSVEETVYENDIPSNQVEPWLMMEAERFRKPVMRIFHTELEAVYEEKNIGMDNDGNKIWENLYAGLFPTHTYGTQTTIGTVEHLKNPSIKAIREYYDKYYVPNNMAICLSGDFDPDKTIELVNKYFGAMTSKPVPAFTPPVEAAITAPVVRHVYGPEAENVILGYRMGGSMTKDADMMMIVDKLLYNGKAGLFDLNLNQAQKALDASSYPAEMADYSVHVFGAGVKEGQTLDQVRDLMIAEIDKLKKGDFPDWLMTAVITDMKYQMTKGYEQNGTRANAFVSSFISGVSWADYVDRINRLSMVTKQQVVDFVKANYGNNYCIVYKHTGEDKNVQKVVKPAITPVSTNRDDQSPFMSSVVGMKVPEIQPVFLDFKKDLQTFGLANNKIPVLYNMNKENSTFDLYYVFDMGTNTNKKLGLAVSYLPYLGTSEYTPKQVQEEFYKLGCSFNVFSSDEQVWVNLSGLNENLNAGMILFEKLLADPKVNAPALKNLVDDILKARKDNKLDKNTILRRGLYNYGMYGASNPFTNILSEKELRAVKASELTDLIKGLTSYEHRVLYYGPSGGRDLYSQITGAHKIPAVLKPVPAMKQFTPQPTDNKVYVVDHDMKQAEIIFLSKSEAYNKFNVPAMTMFNEYFGGTMGSVVFQELRESKALAYSTSSQYRTPRRMDLPCYMYGYIGTQADKLPEAMAGMTNLFNNMPESDVLFASAKASVIQSIRSERITKAQVLFRYESARRLGLDYDIRKDIYERVPSMTLADVRAFSQQYARNKTWTVLVLGNLKLLDQNALGKYGTVKVLTKKDVFGY